MEGCYSASILILCTVYTSMEQRRGTNVFLCCSLPNSSIIHAHILHGHMGETNTIARSMNTGRNPDNINSVTAIYQEPLLCEGHVHIALRRASLTCGC